jgi:alpha-galactosidase
MTSLPNSITHGNDPCFPSHSADPRSSDVRRRSPFKLNPLPYLLALVLALIAPLSTLRPARAADNGLGQSPLMGWSSWSSMGKGVSDAKIRAVANAMVAQLPGYPAGTTLKSLGYVYVNIDAGWRDYTTFDANGRETWDKTKFPNGIAPVAAYVHSLGLKLGIYLQPGMIVGAYNGNYPILGTSYHTKDITDTSKPGNTNAGASAAYRIDFTKAGANEYIQSYADLMAAWGIDYIKFDFVGPGGGSVAADDRPDMQAWLLATLSTPPGSRPIWIELSNSLSFTYASTWKAVSNGWRIDGDIESGGGASWANVAKRFSDSPKWAPFEGSGGWGDFDSVPLGDGAENLTNDERRTTMTLWSICGSPLILGRDLTKLNTYDLTLITNPEVIAVNQAGRVALPVSQSSSQQVWRVKNADGSWTVALFNLGSGSATVTTNFANDLGLSGTASVRDLWTHAELGSFSGSFSSPNLPTHACRLLKVTGSGVVNQVAAPTFSPAGGTYASAPSVTISTTTSGASIRYTLDGSTPGETAGTLYSGPVNIAATATLKAIAYESGMTDSTVTSALYTIGSTPPTLTFEAESLAYTPNGAVASVQSDTNSSGGKWVQLAATSAGAYIDFAIPGVPTGTYQVQMEWKGNNNRGILALTVDGTPLGGTLDQYSASQIYPTTSFGTVTFGATGPHTIRLTATGKNASSSNYYLSADKFTLVGQ